MAIPSIRFGTDGWRAIIAEEYTFENVRRISQAVSGFLGAGRTIVVGYDTRFGSACFAQEAARVFKANGLKVVLSDRPAPTPALSFATKMLRADLGVMITASHNPAEYNGYKLKTPDGGGAGTEITAAVERSIGKTAVRIERACALPTRDLTGAYVSFIRSYLDRSVFKRRRFRVLVDAMYGAGGGFIERILEGSGVEVVSIHTERNPGFGGRRPEPLQQYLPELQQRLRNEPFDLGLALDGDADRIAAVAPGGVFIHPQKILGLLALHLIQDRHKRGGIVKTICGTTMIDHIARDLGVELYETPVGFKYISKIMLQKEIVAGGEEAGGMGVRDYIPERDGSLAGLLLLEMVACRRIPMDTILARMERAYGRFHYVRKDLHLSRRYELKKLRIPRSLLGKKVIQTKDYDGLKILCEDESWLMFRGSGTEPLMRLYAEARSLARAQRLLSLGERLLHPPA